MDSNNTPEELYNEIQRLVGILKDKQANEPFDVDKSIANYADFTYFTYPKLMSLVGKFAQSLEIPGFYIKGTNADSTLIITKDIRVLKSITIKCLDEGIKEPEPVEIDRDDYEEEDDYYEDEEDL